MKQTLLALSIAVALAASPAFAAKTKKAKTTHPKPAAKSQQALEDEAWSDSPKSAKKPVPAKKTTTAKKTTDGPTVKLANSPAPAKPAAPEVKPPDKPTVATTPENPPASTPDTTAGKSAQDLEKMAQSSKDPRQALATYNKLLETNPTYQYAGDVYSNMYNLSVRSHADTLDQLKYAGLAAKNLQAGLSRSPASAQQINHYKKLEEDLTNKWIQDEIQKIMAGKE